MTHDDQPQPARTPFDALTDVALTRDGEQTARITRGRQHPNDPPTDVTYLDHLGRPVPLTGGTRRLNPAFDERFTTSAAGAYFTEDYARLFRGLQAHTAPPGQASLPLAPAADRIGAPSGDILDEIDATIAATTSPCAACGTRLPPNWASFFYCDEDCQKSWLIREARPAARPRRPIPYLLPLTYHDLIRMPDPPSWWLDPAVTGHRVTTPDSEATAQSARFLAGLFRDIGDVFTRFVETISAQITAAFSHIERSGLPRTLEQLNPQEPTDPMERALWFRRNRNTGPKPSKQRAPRRIDPRGDR